MHPPWHLAETLISGGYQHGTDHEHTYLNLGLAISHDALTIVCVATILCQ